MHVVDFFSTLAEAVNIEIVEARLPKAWIFLAGIRMLLPNIARYPLLENLKDRGRIAIWRFADEKMYVLGHHNITNQKKAVALADFCDGFHEEISSGGRAEKR